MQLYSNKKSNMKENTISPVLSYIKQGMKIDRTSNKLTGWKYYTWMCAKYGLQWLWYAIVVYAIIKLFI